MNIDNPIQHPLRGSLIIIMRQVLGRPVCDRGAIPRTLVQSNVVRNRLIILINEEIKEANWMVSNSAKLDRKTKQHTQFGVSASNGSRDMARTKSWRKKNNKANWMVSNSAKLDRRTKQHTEFGVSASNGSRDMARTKSWQKKKKKKRKKKEKRKMNIDNPIKHPLRGSLIIIIIIITRQVLGRPVCDRGVIPRR